MVNLKNTVGAFEAKTHLSSLLDRVERGDRILITRHGRVVAVLAPIHAGKRPKDLVALGHEALACTEGVDSS